MNLSGLSQILINSLTGLIQNYGLLAVFSLMTAESALIPIPSEVTMPFAGFLAGRGVINFWTAIVVGALGNLSGSLLAYWLGFSKGEDWTRLAIDNWGKWLLIRQKDFDRAKSWFQNHGETVTFTSRLLPIVRTFISLPAGIAKMNLYRFSFFTLAGSLIWSGFLAYLGLKLGQNWLSIEPYFRRFQVAIIIAGVVAVSAFLWRHLRKD
jgi:membrane protein DedA with SNARE-associated domain